MPKAFWVQGMIGCGCVEIIEKSEYHGCAILSDFFATYLQLARDRFCGMQFVHFAITEMNPNGWLYFYRKIAEPAYEASGYTLGSVTYADFEAGI